MRHTLTYAWRTLSLGITAYALVYTREVPSAYAETIVDTNCSTPLNLPDTTYRLTTNATTSCIISADNIILDGQNLYSVTGNVQATTILSTLTMRNIPHITGSVYGKSNEESIDNLIIDHSTVDGNMIQINNVSVINNSNVLGYMYAFTGISIINSSTDGTLMTYGTLSVTNSTINNSILLFGSNSDVTVIDSTINGYITTRNSGNGDVSLVNSTINGGGGELYNSSTIATYGTCTATDSTITNPAVVNCGTLTVTDNAPSLTVTPLTLSLEQGDSFNPFSGVSASDTKDGSLTGDVSVIGSVGTEPGTYPLVYSVTDHGTTLFNAFDEATTTVGPTTASTTRTVTRNGAATPTESESSSQATWVGHRSDGGGPTRTTDTSSTTETTTPTTQSLDATLAELRTILAQPIATTDTTQLAKLVDLLTQLLAVLVQLIAKGG